MSSSPWKRQHGAELAPLGRAGATVESVVGQFSSQRCCQLIQPTLTQPLLRFTAHERLFWKCQDANGRQWNGTVRIRPRSSQVALEKTKEVLRKEPSPGVVQGSTDRGWTHVGGGDSEAKHPPVMGQP